MHKDVAYISMPHIYELLYIYINFPGGSVVKKKSICLCRRCRNVSPIPGSGRSLGKENDKPLQYTCQENPMDRGAWRATVCESQT